MSGGVDSSVIALLLSDLFHTLQGELTLYPVYMRNWSTLEESDKFEPGSGGAAGCEWQQEWEGVQGVCRHLKLPEPRLIDLSKEYWRDVFAPSLDDWAAGLTPNPDVLCNREIKFGALLDRLIPPSTRDAQRITPQGPKSWLATGHYARLVYPSSAATSGQVTEPELHRASHRFKDQSYFLSSVPATSFAHALFPLANIEKDQVRRLAKAYALPTAEKKESMGLCFVGKRGKGQEKRSENKRFEGEAGEVAALTSTSKPSLSHAGSDTRRGAAPTFGSWLSSYLSPSSPYTSPGPFVTLAGDVLGHHQGLHTLTIGQRARLPGLLQKWFVARKEVGEIGDVAQVQRAPGGGQEGRAIVVPGADHPLLLCTAVELPLSTFKWVAHGGPPAELFAQSPGEDGPGMKLLAQVRHRTEETPCQVTLRSSPGDPSSEGMLHVSFAASLSAPFESPSPDGQATATSHSPSASPLPGQAPNVPGLSRDPAMKPSAICPGQVLALYDGNRCLGSAVIPAGAVRLLGEQV
ncbi:5-methylaminomethyl-2-thiouridylate-methyltransferase [Microstroma glucosiphilum]|uniref:tRNA-5-taurinomethyluridine 2-sulfurtransferase n=1 Tax=Pseudomicrostroma glucosiphilum TaxID=1684307 RepID=A0A316TZ06_9BASI|nr:5-methylaminomethyl-2-thiouridylate-methyltransferase [Pseudomicrostroma glucosiphilum]PWN18280.1 5-methylaminomethyl-2-thiouridylate-methyltransferase [Pseudomicrostroma glucosiphilum]